MGLVIVSDVVKGECLQPSRAPPHMQSDDSQYRQLVKIVFRLVLIVAGFAGAPCGNELIAAGTLVSLAGRFRLLSGGRAEVVQFALEIIHV